MRKLALDLARDRRGVTAVEYGFVLPVLVLMVLGGVWAGMLTFSVNAMDLAAQSAARCMAVDAVNCGTVGATQAYAQTRYAGPNIAPVFTATANGCGHTVKASANFDLDILPGVASVPLSVSACYP